MSDPCSPARQPFSFGSQRASPFRRPESPLGRSPSTVRAVTPQGSPLKQSTPSASTSKHTSTPSQPHTPSLARGNSETDHSWIRHDSSAGIGYRPTPSKSPIPFQLPSRNPSSESPAPSTVATARPPMATRRSMTTTTKSASADPISSIPPHHLHTMRESFAVLDRNNAGCIKTTDVAAQLSELGLDSSAATLSQYFPLGSSSLNLGAYLNLLAKDLAELSRQDELREALSAFDDDDSGQIDVEELRDALLHTAPENGTLSEQEIDMVLESFVGRRAFKKGQTGASLGSKREVFRYGDFISAVWGGSANGSEQVS